MTALTAAVVLEAIAVDFLISQRLIRIIALVIAVYSVVMIWALIAAERIRPSYVGDQLVLRRGRKIFAKVPSELIKAVTKERTFAEQVNIDNNTLTLGGTHGTDTTITLNRPVEALRDTYPWQRRRTTPVTRIRLYTDGILDATNFRN
ncbi:hypothetical protein QP027_10750 [Corynebacterium breve]|uniref:PH domain-containing protein n=1 Tax=Corynebacterium breve TaxID=3049799 RepID=A0ABY8VD10_9CORY|nr:hypothetical protein [Corynebacterium breve]WIM67556.1 hypothetical protein QP027_10750 [Corynebacterium breve]